VPRDLVPIYRDIILPLADVCVPNQFEAELLTGRRIRSLADALAVMELMHERGVGTVILSSTQLESASATLVALASQRLSPSLTSMASPLPTPTPAAAAAAADSAAQKPPAEVDTMPFVKKFSFIS
jgi:pyridoxal/pyridoxine/pyridoxamine kinase